MTTLYLVRHAEASGNLLRTFQGHTDADLTENGYRQLCRLSEKFRELSLDAIYSSPLKRAMETARAVNSYHSLEIITDKRLMEINGGDFEGESWLKLPELFSEIYPIWEKQPHLFTAPNGESMAQVYRRMIEVTADIAAANKDKTVAVITHGCALRAYLCYAGGRQIEQLHTVGWCDNTGISRVEYDDNGAPSLIFANDNEHLGEYSTFSKQDWWKLSR